MSPKNKPDELYLTRVYDAPVKAVWDAWTDPKQVAKWWGPRGFTITTHGKDLRPGGYWKYTMHGPDGVDYENRTVYHEVEKYSRLVYDHGGSEDRPPMFRVTVTFTEVKGKTKMEMTMGFASPEGLEEARKIIKKANGNGTWDRLAEHLGEETTGKDLFVINRTFPASIATMFDLWTNPEHFAQWLPPTGFTMKFSKADIRSGGSTAYSMTNGTFTMYGRANYLEVTKPNRIIYTQQFCDEKGNLARHPLAPTWPATMLTTVTFAEEGANETRVTINWEIHGEATATERETFHKAKAGMEQGWGGSFEKLDAYLEKKS